MNTNEELRDSIIAAVCGAYFGLTDQQVTKDDILSRLRTKHVSTCRRLSMLIYRRHYLRGTEETGNLFNRDHSTTTYNDQTGLWDIRHDHLTALTYKMAAKLLKLRIPQWMQVADTTQAPDRYFASMKSAAAFKRMHRKVHGRIMCIRDGVVYDITKGWENRRRTDDEWANEGEYIKPKNWTAAEREKLRQVRGNGIAVSLP